MNSPAIDIQNLSKTYSSGFKALEKINLQIQTGEIFALLGPNGAGKTTLISIICGIVNPSSGAVHVNGFDILKSYRQTRAHIGLVPQELTVDLFESVWNTISFSRGLFGFKPNPKFLEQLLRDLSLWEKRDQRIITLSGGMKRRVMIAKALAHEPKILFLDEPTAGVDVELRRDMWHLVRRLRESGVTIILTTHYLEEAEDLADRIGVINNGKLILVEEKTSLMKRLGKKQLILKLQNPLPEVPKGLDSFSVELSSDRTQLTYTFDAHLEQNGISPLLKELANRGIDFRDVNTSESSLEDIFVQLVRS